MFSFVLVSIIFCFFFFVVKIYSIIVLLFFLLVLFRCNFHIKVKKILSFIIFTLLYFFFKNTDKQVPWGSAPHY